MLNSSFKKLMTRNIDEQIMDRFIPSNASQQAYRSNHSQYHNGVSNERRPLREDAILNLNNITEMEGAFTLTRAPLDHVTTPDNEHRDSIADALNFHHQDRVLSFSPNRNNHSGNSSTDHIMNDSNSRSSNSTSSVQSPIFSMRSFTDSPSALPSRTSMDSDISIGSSPKQSHYNKYKKKKKNNSKSKIAYKILDAAHLRDDFYSNLISWSKSSGKIAVGLGSNVHLWSDTEGVDSLELPETQIISCLSWSDGEMVLVASTSGDIRLFFQGLGVVIDCNNPSGQGICCITWVPGSESQFYAGDEAGYVLYFEIEDRQLLKLVHRFKCHQHQVCGIAISNDLKEITVGGNDNCCTIWDVENIKAPVLKYYLAHKAAVKAVAYCPWSKSLLATGGGSKDRTIRFWHTSTGSLLNSHKTKGQITSLIWSKRKRQITATYGFGDVDKPIFLSVLSYPDMETLAEVEAAPNLRALSAVMSPDATSICVAANDETVRFYKLWDAKDPIILDYQQNGVFGSDIIELSEGITTHGDFIR